MSIAKKPLAFSILSLPVRSASDRLAWEANIAFCTAACCSLPVLVNETVCINLLLDIAVCWSASNCFMFKLKTLSALLNPVCWANSASLWSAWASILLPWETLAWIALALESAILKASPTSTAVKESLPTVEADKPRSARAASTLSVAGFAHKGISPSFIPSNKVAICVDTKASTGKPPITPLSFSEKFINSASRVSGSLPNSCMVSGETPAVANCCLALVTLGKLMPETLTAFAKASSFNLPTIRFATEPSSIFTFAGSILLTLATPSCSDILAFSSSSPWAPVIATDSSTSLMSFIVEATTSARSVSARPSSSFVIVSTDSVKSALSLDTA